MGWSRAGGAAIPSVIVFHRPAPSSPLNYPE
jgi:hypothetical protein